MGARGSAKCVQCGLPGEVGFIVGEGLLVSSIRVRMYSVYVM